MRAMTSCGALTVAVALICAPGWGVDLHIDAAKAVGHIRPVHGANCGPITYGEVVDLTAFHREAGFPYTRLHDCHWPNPDVVDIHAIFPNFQADPSLPESYDFRKTDDYLAAVTNSGARIVYRLGESIEHTKRKYFVHPPADFQKWAEICAGIIRHYNDGWANGFHHGITYWEIWNEPENQPAMWTGSDEDYFRLYEVTSKTIKARFPGLKVGGPALGYTGNIANGHFEPGDYLKQFVQRCRERSLPLDFFSWHLYSDDPSECVVRAKGIRDLLDRNGFPKTELHLNEWNYLPGNDWTPMGLAGQGAARERAFEQMGGMPGAAYAGCVLLFLQDSPVDLANYYSADAHGFGMFTEYAVPKKPFYVFKAFNALMQTPVRLATLGSQPSKVAVCAGIDADHSRIGVMACFLSADSTKHELSVSNVPWATPSVVRTFAVDSDRNFVQISEFQAAPGDVKMTLELKAPAVGFVTITPK